MIRIESMLDNLTTEARNPASEQLDSLSALSIVKLINSEDEKVAKAVGEEAPAIAKAIEVIKPPGTWRAADLHGCRHLGQIGNIGLSRVSANIQCRSFPSHRNHSRRPTSHDQSGRGGRRRSPFGGE